LHQNVLSREKRHGANLSDQAFIIQGGSLAEIVTVLQKVDSIFQGGNQEFMLLEGDYNREVI
jgi:hypothetical protein